MAWVCVMTDSSQNDEGRVRRSQSLHAAVLQASRSPGFLWFVAFTVATLLFGAYRAYIVRWLCDDIFITFRYAENFLAGHGFVFNIGERVEGYTHFTWLCLITFVQWLGFGPEGATQWMGEVFYLITLATFAVISYRIAGREGLLVPIATPVLALHYDFHIWASSGLETPFFTALVSLGFFTMCFSKSRPSVRYLLAGFLFTLGVMTRPDGVLFLFLALAFETGMQWLNRAPVKIILSTIGYFLLPVIVFLVPYAIWKIVYYGDLLPNTFYAKSGDVSYFDQGFFYIWTYVRGYPTSWLILLAVPYLIVVWRGASGRFLFRMRELADDVRARSLVLALLFVVVYGVVFIARVGGDFMYARFIIPIVPLVYFIIEMSLRQLLVTRRSLLKASIVALLILVVSDKTTRDDYLTDTGSRGSAKVNDLSGISDECWFWTHDLGNGLNLMSLQKIQGRIMRTFFEGESVTVVLRGQNNFAYYGTFQNCIEAAGLTDKYVARLPLVKRGRPGHEKEPPWEYLMKRRANFIFFRHPQQDTSSFRKIYFRFSADSLEGYMYTYDPALLHRLDERFPGRIEYVRFEEYLDDYIRGMTSMTRQRVEADFRRFQDYYFGHVADQGRERAFLTYLRQSEFPGN
jgi:hypothetical protein